MERKEIEKWYKQFHANLSVKYTHYLRNGVEGPFIIVISRCDFDRVLYHRNIDYAQDNMGKIQEEGIPILDLTMIWSPQVKDGEWFITKRELL